MSELSPPAEAKDMKLAVTLRHGAAKRRKAPLLCRAFFKEVRA